MDVAWFLTGLVLEHRYTWLDELPMIGSVVVCKSQMVWGLTASIGRFLSCIQVGTCLDVTHLNGGSVVMLDEQ